MPKKKEAKTKTSAKKRRGLLKQMKEDLQYHFFKVRITVFFKKLYDLLNRLDVVGRKLCLDELLVRNHKLKHRVKLNESLNIAKDLQHLLVLLLCCLIWAYV